MSKRLKQCSRCGTVGVPERIKQHDCIFPNCPHSSVSRFSHFSEQYGEIIHRYRCDSCERTLKIKHGEHDHGR